MSMLSEPRRRQKWTLNPRGTLWSKDENKVGQKMLEKFGWKSGDGLGKESQGMKDPIKVNANHNNKGLGHEAKDDDVWLAHKDNFADVLAALNSEHNSGANLDNEDGTKETQSLASASKKSKKRVHYEKFTKGKDLSSYSQTDLSCILGEKNRKKIKLEEKSTAEEKEIAPENSKFVQGGSINDYFKMKMKMMSEKKATKLSESYIFPKDKELTSTDSNPETEMASKDSNSEPETDGNSKKKKKKKKDKKSKDEQPPVVEENEPKISKKKRKTSNNTTIESLEPLSLSMDMIEQEKSENNEQVTKKKRKKNKSSDVQNETKNEVPIEEEPVAKKKKSKKEKHDNDLTKNSESEPNEVSEKKKKDKKNREVKEIETKSAEITEPSPPVLTTPMASSYNKWESSDLGNSAANEKFRRLMGIKNTSSDVPKANTNNSGLGTTNVSKWFTDQEQQYEKARDIRLGKKGLGLGFSQPETKKKPVEKMNKVIKFDEEEPLNDVDNEKKLEKVKPECDSEEAAENVTKKEKKKKSKKKSKDSDSEKILVEEDLKTEEKSKCDSTSEITEVVTKKEKKKKSKKKSKESDSEILVEENTTQKQEEEIKTEEKSEVLLENGKKLKKKTNKPSVDQVQDFKGSSFKKIKGYAV